VAAPIAFGKYLVTEVLGAGAMGVVYKGFDPDIRRDVAIKTIGANYRDASGVVEAIAARFRIEAQAAGRLTHPGIVGVYDFGQAQEVTYIVMEFVSGGTLNDCFARRVRFADEDIPGIMRQLLEALGHAHSNGVWHRDIKPANIMITGDGRLKIADFGIARIASGQSAQATIKIGTPSHMAPEQFVGGEVDHRIDLYAAGVVLYQLLTGRLPFSGSVEALMYKAVHEVPLPPSAVPGAARPTWYDPIVLRALSKDPSRRYPDASMFIAALEAGAGGVIDDQAWSRTLALHPTQSRPWPASPPLDGASGGASMNASPARWDPAVLSQVEGWLARSVGPLAGVLVRRAARVCTDLPALSAMLAQDITDPAGRSAFLSRTGTITSTGPRPPAPAIAAQPPPISELVLARAQALLAAEVGPIAKVLVKRAAQQVQDRDTFFKLLGDAVGDPQARRRLLANLAKL